MTTIDTAPSRTFALRTTAPQDQGDGGTVWVAMASGANAPGPSVVFSSDSADIDLVTNVAAQDLARRLGPYQACQTTAMPWCR